MKIAPWDCQSGIGEHEAESTATVWPNPGSTGFTAFVNGPVVARGTLELYNAQGQLATSTDVLQSSATVNATNLAPGVYLYRITDGQGALRATGRWVKE
ncbi:MAG: T9SS type A sorting domain-containing protein [Bacteroidetes bacterium]|nr:T9SS type A sorting domain-containing protein [Bacteroidota bacterium]